MKNVAVIGAGTMGNGIAHTFAQFDFKVQLIDRFRNCALKTPIPNTINLLLINQLICRISEMNLQTKPSGIASLFHGSGGGYLAQCMRSRRQVMSQLQLHNRKLAFQEFTICLSSERFVKL